MRMRDSEIFNNYIRLAEDAGLIGEDEFNKTADPNDKTRYDRYSFSDLEALYGHKLGPNDKEGDSIVDVAHPETAVAVPAYDAMNSVVENLHQRNDIMTYVALKDPDGHLVQRRYVAAQQKLINSLVSVGFEMDSLEEAGLMSLADDCAGSIIKKEAALKKESWFQLALMALSFAPMVYDWAVNKGASKTVDKKTGKVNPKAASKLSPFIKSRVAQSFKYGLGMIGLYTVYKAVRNRVASSADKVDQDADELVAVLDKFQQYLPGSVKQYMSTFKQKVQAVKAAYTALDSHSASANQQNADRSFYTNFQKAAAEYQNMRGTAINIVRQMVEKAVQQSQSWTGSEMEDDARALLDWIEAEAPTDQLTRAISGLDESIATYNNIYTETHQEVMQQIQEQKAEIQPIENLVAANAQQVTDTIATQAASPQGMSQQQMMELLMQQNQQLQAQLDELKAAPGA